ncbi:hypothetical protein D3C86_2229800 [compost metagenome]
MAVWESDSGGALKGRTMDVHSTEKAPKISSASRPRVRNVGSLTNSLNSDRMSAK